MLDAPEVAIDKHDWSHRDRIPLKSDMRNSPLKMTEKPGSAGEEDITSCPFPGVEDQLRLLVPRCMQAGGRGEG